MLFSSSAPSLLQCTVASFDSPCVVIYNMPLVLLRYYSIASIALSEKLYCTSFANMDMIPTHIAALVSWEVSSSKFRYSMTEVKRSATNIDMYSLFCVCCLCHEIACSIRPSDYLLPELLTIEILFSSPSSDKR